MRPPETCPNCGAEVPRHAKACPGCGADENSGWSEDAEQATAADLGLPEEDFDYDEFVKQEFGKPPKPPGLHWFWWLTGIALLILIILAWVI
jgi:zinc-ribbon domain